MSTPLIKRPEAMLVQAQTGEITAIAYAVTGIDGGVATGWVAGTPEKLVGAVRRLALRLESTGPRGPLAADEGADLRGRSSHQGG